MKKQAAQDTKEIVQNLFHDQFKNAEVKFGYVSIPAGERLPAEGTTFHEEQEYSFITKGSLIGESGGVPFEMTSGEASFIPAKELHWCMNNGDEPVEIVFALVNA
ncbi:cupin domain-containing protein [Sporosarcina sp. BI001-red]|uniref:cupin domain-containing protein n=1 Tax=Sporosarcina sp. BI001-red TaxID=2282866 RepID=UPI000E2397C6|nr:cupin domain-containing protein [Sporosarcina sp. BI001-red]REB08571.1 cupin domain-containing protein [Sporosarcina sp. BI001-red]